jgi:hypothetical protein
MPRQSGYKAYPYLAILQGLRSGGAVPEQDTAPPLARQNPNATPTRPPVVSPAVDPATPAET